MTSSITDRETLIDVLMPQMGTSIVEGTLIAWNKSVGDPVAVDEPICEVSTDKVDTDCPSPIAGTVAELVAEAGETVEVGSVIARVAVSASTAMSDIVPAALPAVAPAPVADVPAGHAVSSDQGSVEPPARISPVVARIAQRHGLDLSAIVGTGQGGRVTKRDALAAVEASPAVAAEPQLHSESPYRADPLSPASVTATAAPPGIADSSPNALGGIPAQLSRMRRSIGTAMLRSQAVAATCHTIVECDMTRVTVRRRRLELTALPLVARAVIDTLHDFPDLNATLDGSTITRYTRVHLGIAVSLGDRGLIVPVIRDAQNLAPEGLAAAVKDLARRARAKQLVPDEVKGATFTITNPGAFGAIIATPVLDVPQVGILDLEAIMRRPVVVVDADENESIAVRPMANLILGWDHRAIDGVYAAQFLAALRRRLEVS